MSKRVLTGRKRLALGFACGVALALGQAPFDLMPVALAGLIAVFWLFRATTTRRQAGWLGWFFGLG